MGIPVGRSSPCVLVCDDEEVVRGLVRASLGGDYTLCEARDGDEAFELARSTRPDLIVLDVMMPGRSGIEVLRALRAEDDVELAATPVVMLTARNRSDVQPEAVAAGADAFLAKPFSPRELLGLVGGLVRPPG